MKTILVGGPADGTERERAVLYPAVVVPHFSDEGLVKERYEKGETVGGVVRYVYAGREPEGRTWTAGRGEQEETTG